MDHPICSILNEISRAFPHRRRAGDFELISGRPLGSQPWATAAAFADKLDWTTLPVCFLDAHPMALRILPAKAACFYLPAYLAADLCDRAHRSDVIDILLCGFGPDVGTPECADVLEDETPWVRSVRRWASLTLDQVAAATLWLEHRACAGLAADQHRIVEALATYWYPRLDDIAPEPECATSGSEALEASELPAYRWR